MDLQVKIPWKPNDMLSDAQMTQFLQTICRTCDACENLITLDPGPEQCDKCAEEEEREAQLEQEEEERRYKVIERKEKVRQNQLKKSVKYETESDSSSDRPLKYTIKKVKNEYTYENDNDLMTIGVSDAESGGEEQDEEEEEQEENVSSTTAQAITTTTTTTTGSASLSFTGPATPTSNASSRLPTGPPQEWSVEGVINFIADTDPALAVHAELFRKHVSFGFRSHFQQFAPRLGVY